MDNGWTRKYCYDCSPHEDENCSHSQAVTIKRRAIKNMLIPIARKYFIYKTPNCVYYTTFSKKKQKKAYIR